MRKSKRPQPTKRPCRKVAVVGSTVITPDDTQQSSDGSVEAGFCGEPFADNGELLSSLWPLLFSMKLFGLYFHREDRHRRCTDDPEWNPATTTTRTLSTWLRGYATIILVLVWLNAVRFVLAFNNSDHGSMLLTKLALLAWFGLVAIMYTAYYLAGHTGQLVEVLLTLPVTQDVIVTERSSCVPLCVWYDRLIIYIINQTPVMVDLTSSYSADS